MIIEIFVAQHQAIHALRDHICQRVLDQIWITMINEARGKLLDDLAARFKFTQHERPAIRGDGAAVKLSDYITSSDSLKVKRTMRTLCHQPSGSFFWVKYKWQRYFYHKEELFL